MMISPNFKRSVAANIHYWRQKTANLSDLTLGEIDDERQNLYRAVSYGLQIEETTSQTLELILQLFELPERRGYWTEWLAILQQAIAACNEREGKERTAKIRLLNQLGFLRRLNRELESAVEVHQEVIAKAEKHDIQETIKAYFYLGNAYYDAHHYNLAQYWAEKALQVVENAEPIIDVKRQAAILNLLGLVANDQGDYQNAKTLYLRAITAWKKTNETTYLARTWNNLGLTHLELKDYDLALKAFSEASSLLIDTVSELDKVKAQMFEGLVYFQQEKWEMAETVFQKANTPYLWQSGDLYHQALLMNNLGNAYLMQGKNAAAESALVDSISLWRRLSDELMLGNSLGALAEVQVKQKRIPVARDSFKKAINYLSKFPDNAWAAKRLEELKALSDLLDSGAASD